jgi:cardiolipin synthase
MTARSVALTRAHLADALTGARFALAPLAAPVVAAGAWRFAAIVVATAWWTDFFDGRIARTTTGTRLGRWDPYADTAVGAGIVIGLAAGRHVPPVPFLAALVLLAAAYVVTDNFAFGQLAQAIGYGPLLWYAAVEDLWALAVLVATIVAVAALDARRFVSYVLPTFFRGVGLSRRR